MDLLNKLRSARNGSDDRYLVHIQFEDKVLGTRPLTPDKLRAYLEAKHFDPEIIEKELAELEPEERVEDQVLQSRTGFKRDHLGIFIGTYQMKANLREMMSSLGITVAKRGSKQTHQHLLDIRAVDLHDQEMEADQATKLRLFRGHELVTEADGFVELTAHVRNAQGESSVIKQHNYVENAETRFILRTPSKETLGKARAGAYLDTETVVSILSYSEGNALGACRSQGFGRFKVTKLELLED